MNAALESNNIYDRLFATKTIILYFEKEMCYCQKWTSESSFSERRSRVRVSRGSKMINRLSLHSTRNISPSVQLLPSRVQNINILLCVLTQEHFFICIKWCHTWVCARQECSNVSIQKLLISRCVSGSTALRRLHPLWNWTLIQATSSSCSISKCLLLATPFCPLQYLLLHAQCWRIWKSNNNVFAIRFSLLHEAWNMCAKSLLFLDTFVLRWSQECVTVSGNGTVVLCTLDSLSMHHHQSVCIRTRRSVCTVLQCW